MKCYRCWDLEKRIWGSENVRMPNIMSHPGSGGPWEWWTQTNLSSTESDYLIPTLLHNNTKITKTYGALSSCSRNAWSEREHADIVKTGYTFHNFLLRFNLILVSKIFLKYNVSKVILTRKYLPSMAFQDNFNAHNLLIHTIMTLSTGFMHTCWALLNIAKQNNDSRELVQLLQGEAQIFQS